MRVFQRFGRASLQHAHKEAWSNEQALNNPEAVDLAVKKVNFIAEHGNKEQQQALQRLIAQVEEITTTIFMLPLGTDPSEWQAEQAETIATLDNIIKAVEKTRRKKFKP